MSKTVDFKKIKQELIKLYTEFLENPEDEITNRKIIAYEGEYGGLQVYNDYLKSQPIPKEIEIGLGGLSTIYQYGLWEENHPAFSNKKILEEAKKILEELKKA